jgi:hypothetical protein
MNRACAECLRRSDLVAVGLRLEQPAIAAAR